MSIGQKVQYFAAGVCVAIATYTSVTTAVKLIAKHKDPDIDGDAWVRAFKNSEQREYDATWKGTSGDFALLREDKRFPLNQTFRCMSPRGNRTLIVATTWGDVIALEEVSRGNYLAHAESTIMELRVGTDPVFVGYVNTKYLINVVNPNAAFYDRPYLRMYRTLANEDIIKLSESDDRVCEFAHDIAAMATDAETVAGISDILKKHYPHLELKCVEKEDSMEITTDKFSDVYREGVAANLEAILKGETEKAEPAPEGTTTH